MDDPHRQHLAQQILIAIVVVLTVLSLLRILTADAQAPTPTAPALAEWSETTQTLLAAAVVGEGGWTSGVDHDAIPWLLYRRWQQIGSGSFDDVIQQYCRALDGGRPWLLELDAAGTQPPSWPVDRASWHRHQPLWLKIRARIGAWAAGKVRNPCPTAVHFGGAMDAPHGALVPARCAGALNRFWTVRRG